MQCPECQKTIPDDATICPYCGGAIKVTEGNVLDEPVRQIKKAYKDTDAMFTNVGDKICKIAKFVCWIGVITSIIMGVSIMFSGCSYSYYIRGAGMSGFLFGLFVAGFGSLSSWVSSLALYAFGDMSRRIQRMEERSR